MSEQSAEPDAQEIREETDGVADQELSPPVRTGVEEVDTVLDSVEDLDGLPVAEHVPVFERAHEQLRGALDGRTDG